MIEDVAIVSSVEMGFREGVVVPGVVDWEVCWVYWMYLTMWKIFEGVEERVIMVVTPADVARRAAMSLVAMPPVPTLEPAVETGLELVDLSDPVQLGNIGNTINIQCTYILHNQDGLSIWVSPWIIGV